MDSSLNISSLTEHKTWTKNDNLSDISIPSCLWLPNGPILNQGPIIKTPPSQQPHCESPSRIQSADMSHHSESHVKEVSGEHSSKCETAELSGFSEFVSNGEAVLREQHVADKFNGILYHVIPAYNKISIIFSSKTLYSQFISALDRELHSRSSNKDNPVYQTHLRGQKCEIRCFKDETSVTVTGPGMWIWRETTFLRLSFGLFKTFTAENEAVPSEQYQYSTPVERRHLPHAVLPLSPIDFARSLSDFSEQDSSHQPTMSDINRRLNVLWDISKTLQTQINQINEMMGQLMQKAKSAQEKESNKEHVSINSTIENQPKSTANANVNNPITVPGTNTYCEAVRNIPLPPNPVVNAQKNLRSDRDTRNSNQNKRSDKKYGQSSNEVVRTETSQENRIPPTLLIGDSILSGVNRKGLKRSVECQPIPGATLEKLLEKIKIYDLKNFENIIIYVAGNDASQKKDIEYIEEKYEQLINYIKSKNPTVTIYLCGVCPRGDTSVIELNEVIKRLNEVHKTVFIDTFKNFYNKDKQLKAHFYKPRDNIHLSSSGTKGLLGSISQHIEIVDSFKYCAYGLTTQGNGRAQHTNQPNHGHGGSKTRRSEGMTHAFSPRNQNIRNNPTYSDEDRCFKCGLTNHKTYECRHKNQLQCYICKFYGHKDSVCWNF